MEKTITIEIEVPKDTEIVSGSLAIRYGKDSVPIIYYYEGDDVGDVIQKCLRRYITEFYWETVL